jgi:hypothetical protein
LQWQIAKDASFTSLINPGSITALASAGFNAKVDATGLSAGNTYYFRFLVSTGASSTVYLLMTVTNADIKGEFVFIDTVKAKTYKASVGKTVTVAASTLRKTFA